MEDVYERLEVLDAHYHSTTFDKVQGGDKTEVIRLDLDRLFGEPDKVAEGVDMASADTVYQYYYDDITLNFHERFGTVDEYVSEQFTDIFYEPHALDQLFIDVVTNHQTQFRNEDESFQPLTEGEAAQLFADKTPTRNIRQGGWYTWVYNRHIYFDTGTGDYAPNEFLSLQFEEDDTTELWIMERRYPIDLETDTQAELDKKDAAKSAFRNFIDQKESNHSDEKLRVADFSHAFGEMLQIYYDFQRGTLGISWIIHDDYPEKILATVPLKENNDLSDINDVGELEVEDFKTDLITHLDRSVHNNTFIGSR
jgi:hypothetical protein